MDLNNKTALITGGTKGIGLGITKALLERGMNVMITGRSEDTLSSIIKEFEDKYPGKILGQKGNVVNLDDMQTAVDKIGTTWGSLDVVIANAGVGHFAPIEELTPEQWHEVIDVNLTGVYNTVKASVSELKKSRGYIITIASLAGTNFFARGAAYNASKFGLVGFTQAVMLDLRHHDIKCTTIMPGSVATHFNNHRPSEADHWKIQPEDIGQMVVDLLNMPARTLPSKVEVRPTKPPKKS